MQKRLSLIMAILTTSASLIACGAQETAVQEGPTALTEEVTQVSEVETAGVTSSDTDLHQEVATEAEKTEAEASVVEPTAEPTLEPTPEPNPYEGIDMESTLPGGEWIATFDGIITKPIFVVFNDETNKKVIVENRKKVQFEKSDTLVIFKPEGYLLSNCEGDVVEILQGRDKFYDVVKFKEDAIITTNKIIVQGFAPTGDWMDEITCTLVATEE